VTPVSIPGLPDLRGPGGSPGSAGISDILSRWGPLVLILALLVMAPLLITDFRLGLLGKFLSLAILAMSLNLIWGYGGMLSLGHGVFFGLGGYAMAMFLKLEASGGKLPDFMFWSGLDRLPFFWWPFQFAWFAFPMTFILPAVLGGGLAYLVFRSRITGVYFALITQALSLIVSILFVGQQAYTGGTNGITNYSTILGFPVFGQSTQMGFYYISVGTLVGIYLLFQFALSSRFGRLLVAMRDDENRVRFMGYNPVMLKTLVFTVSCGAAGIAGALYVPQVGIVSPTNMGILPSIEIAVWVAVGGRGTLLGPVIGAILVNSAKSGLSESFPMVWQFFLGGLFIGSVLLFPVGIVGFFLGFFRGDFFRGDFFRSDFFRSDFFRGNLRQTLRRITFSRVRSPGRVPPHIQELER
jgi:urea transport system permease protein